MARMTSSDDGAYYPNNDVLLRGLGIYLTEMREFIVPILRQKRGSQLEQTIINSLGDYQRQEFSDNLKKNGGDVARSIDYGFIPNLVERNWHDLFQDRFTNARAVRTFLRRIRECRNEVSHGYIPNSEDAPVPFVQSGLYQISEVLRSTQRDQSP